jgi:hypothetical protein
MKHQRISISEASRLTGKTRETVSRAARDLPSHPGPRNATLYDSTMLLARLYVGEDGELTYGEAMRKLAIARREQIEQDMRLKTVEHISVEQHNFELLDWLQTFRSILDRREGRLINDRLVVAIGDELREAMISQRPVKDQDKWRRWFLRQDLEHLADWVPWYEKKIVESEWAQQERAARTRLHDAWERNSAERSRESLEALKAAQAELQKLEDASPYKDIEW